MEKSSWVSPLTRCRRWHQRGPFTWGEAGLQIWKMLLLLRQCLRRTISGRRRRTITTCLRTYGTTLTRRRFTRPRFLENQGRNVQNSVAASHLYRQLDSSPASCTLMPPLFHAVSGGLTGLASSPALSPLRSLCIYLSGIQDKAAPRFSSIETSQDRRFQNRLPQSCLYAIGSSGDKVGQSFNRPAFRI